MLDVTILSNLVLDRILGIPLLLAIVAFYSFDFCLRVGGIVSLSSHGASVTHRMIHGLDHPFLSRACSTDINIFHHSIDFL